MKSIFPIIVFLFISVLSLGQTVGKIGEIDKDAISKIGSVSTTSIAKIGDIDAPAYCKNCMEILTSNPGSSDGLYTIDPDGSGAIEPFECYCDMTTDGGGWTMVGYYKNPANYGDFMHARTDAAYGTEIANPNSSSAWADWRPLAGVTWPAEFAIILDQPTFTSWGQDNNAKVIHHVKTREVMPNYGTITNLELDDNLYYKINISDGWTDVGTSSASGANYWYPRDASNNYLISFYHHDPIYSAYYGLGIPGGDNSWHHSAHMFIR